MPQNVKRRGFFSLISPFLVYFGVSLIVQIVAVIAVVLQNLPMLMEGLDMEQLENIQNMQQMYVSEEAMNMLLEQYMQHLALITAFSALCVIPFFVWMFCRDKKYELRLGISQVPKAKAGRYVFIVELIGLGIIVPIAEELMFRGLIYRRIRCMIGPRQAIVVSGLVFGMYHGNLVQGLYGFLVGCIMAWLYEKYGSLKAPILFHVCANLVSVIATEADIFTWIFQSYIRVVVTTVACAACGAASYVKIRNVFMEPQKDIEINQE